MSEETKKAIEELVKATEGNDLAKAFLRGYKSGLDTAKDEEKKPRFSPEPTSGEKMMIKKGG